MRNDEQLEIVGAIAELAGLTEQLAAKWRRAKRREPRAAAQDQANKDEQYGRDLKRRYHRKNITR